MSKWTQRKPKLDESDFRLVNEDYRDRIIDELTVAAGRVFLRREFKPGWQPGDRLPKKCLHKRALIDRDTHKPIGCHLCEYEAPMLTRRNATRTDST